MRPDRDLTEEAPPTTDTAAVVTGMLAAYNDRDFDEFGAKYSADAVISYPQSGERITGRDNILAMVRAFPSAPTFAVTTTRAADNWVLVEADADYGGGTVWKAVIVYTVEGGSVVAETAYFAAPFEPATWRAPFVNQ